MTDLSIRGRTGSLRWWRFGVFAAPGLLVYVALVAVPVALSLGYSLTDRNPFRPPADWVAFDNYRLLLSDPDFLRTLGNTSILTLIVTIVPNVLGLSVALLLDRPARLYRWLRTVFFAPVVLSSVVVSVIWQALLNDDGLLNRALREAGVGSPPGWLSDPDLALYSVSWIISWQMLGFCTVVYLAGLQGVPQSLREAAALDGAGPLRQFRAVTWPLLAPAVTINTVMLMITGFKVYDHVQVITNGGPGSGTTATIAFDIIRTGFTGNRVGYASAMATVMLIVIAVVSAIALRLLQRREVSL